MAYASIIDVNAIDSSRATYTATSRPNADQVAIMLDMVSAEVDAILRIEGYQVPVPTTASSALSFLRGVTAKGAMALVEQSAPTSDKKDPARAMWLEARQLLMKVELDAPKDEDSSNARSGIYASAMLWPDMLL